MNTTFKLLTLEFVKELCADIGISVNRTSYGELRVNFRNGGTEDTAYYTTMLDDALSTAVAMHQHERRAHQ